MKRDLRVVTLWRPWGWAITRSTKRVENRDWRPPLECPWYMAVREGKKWGGIVAGSPPPESWPGGRVLGLAEVIGYADPGSPGGEDWRDPDAWGWLLGRVVPIEPLVWPPANALASRSMQGLVRLQPARFEEDSRLLATLRGAWSEAVVEAVRPKPLGNLFEEPS